MMNGGRGGDTTAFAQLLNRGSVPIGLDEINNLFQDFPLLVGEILNVACGHDPYPLGGATNGGRNIEQIVDRKFIRFENLFYPFLKFVQVVF